MDYRSEEAVSPVVGVILVVFITIALAVGIFTMLGGLGSDQGTSATGYSQFSSSDGEYSATVMDGGNAESFQYRVNGELVYTLTDAHTAVGTTIPLSEHAQLCAGDTLTVIGIVGDSQNTLQTEEIKQDINCTLPGTDTSVTADYDGTSWVVDATLTNTGDEAREYSVVLTDGDTYEGVETITLNPGESTTVSTTTDSFTEDAPLQIGVISPSSDESSYSLSGGSLGGGSSSTSYTASEPTVASSFSPVSSGTSSNGASSDGDSGDGSTTTDSSTISDDDSTSPLKLSASRIGTGEDVDLFATLATTKETADETFVVRATETSGTTSEKARTTYSLSNDEYKQIVESFAFDSPGEYLITATIEGTGEVHTAGTLTVVEKSDVTVESTAYTPSDPRVGDEIAITADLHNSGDADGDVTVQFFESGKVYDEQVVTVPANEAKTVTASLPAAEERMYKFHVGVVEPAIVEQVAETYVGPESKVSTSLSASPDTPNIDEEVTFSASATHEEDVAIAEYQWDFGDGTTTTTSTGTTTHTYAEAGVRDYTVTAVAEDGESATAGQTLLVASETKRVILVDDFEDYDLGTAGWDYKNDGSNGVSTVSDTRASAGSQSLRSHQPNTGAPSHFHLWNDFGGANSQIVSYSANFYIDNKENSGSADGFSFSLLSDQHTDTAGVKSAFSVNLVTNGNAITARDGTSNVKLRNDIRKQWVNVEVVVDYAANEYTVLIDGTNEGTFAMPDAGTPDEFTHIAHRNDNYDGWIDSVVIEEQ